MNNRLILVVDDSRIMRNIVRNTVLALKFPCHFIEAANGKEALEQIERNIVHLVLLDWNMPELSGLDFLKKVRSLPDKQNIPIIMVTSEAAKYNVIEALKNGATDYIVKPISEDILLEKLAKIKF